MPFGIVGCNRPVTPPRGENNPPPGDASHNPWYLRSQTPARAAKDNPPTTAQEAGSEVFSSYCRFLLPNERSLQKLGP